MADGAALYVNDPPDGMKAHLFREAAVRGVTLQAETADEPATSVCGTVRSYGPFEAADVDAGEHVCGNCLNKTEAADE